MSVELSTARLRLTELTLSDVTFIHELFNDPDCIRFIGDRGLSTEQDALDYLQNRLMDSYRRHGYGLYRVSKKNSNDPMGICGLVNRDDGKPPDIGFAFLPVFRRGGYCTEASMAVLSWVKHQQISDEILAYTNPDNEASIRVLEKLGLERGKITQLPGQNVDSLILKTHLLTNRRIS